MNILVIGGTRFIGAHGFLRQNSRGANTFTGVRHDDSQIASRLWSR